VPAQIINLTPMAQPLTSAFGYRCGNFLIPTTTMFTMKMNLSQNRPLKEN
jgi:hypothetical protein